MCMQPLWAFENLIVSLKGFFSPEKFLKSCRPGDTLFLNTLANIPERMTFLSDTIDLLYSVILIKHYYLHTVPRL